jgi:phosphoribosyl-ATP pyrophosphohydrolase/phosphoribosyl-AMP cyclohydrolase
MSVREKFIGVFILMHEDFLNSVKYDDHGLVPAIVQDIATGDVLMMAYMNAESLRKTLESGETWFWSRSRKEFWHKGGTSGNTQQVDSISVDCDGDTLLVRVTPRGPACHTGEQTCFSRSVQMNKR